MTGSVSEPGARAALRALVTGAPAAQALAVTVIGWVFCVPLTVSLFEWPAAIGALVTLVILTGALLWARRDLLDFSGSLSLTLIAFLAWAVLSVVWSPNHAEVAQGILLVLGLTVLGVGLAIARDPIQLVRATGTAMRGLLTASLLVEIYAGIFLNAPIEVIGVRGLLTEGGPVQGLFGTQTLFAFAAIIGLISFTIETRTRSVRHGVTAYSVVLALVCLGFSATPIMVAVALVVLAVTLVLYGIRQAAPATRPGLQWALLAMLAIGPLLVVLGRERIAVWVGADGDIHERYQHWPQLISLASAHPLEGWGWTMMWHSDLLPYSALPSAGTAAMSSYLDVYLQLGLVGLVLFLILVLTALVRSWQLASNRRSVTYTWPTLIMVTIVVSGIGESILLGAAGWTLLAMSATLASRSTGWLERFRETRRALPVPHERD